jgi:hypothetical protein
VERRRWPLADAFFTNGEKVKNRTRLTIVLFAWSCLAGLALAVPARPLYEPEPIPKLSPTASLAGTTWVGMLFIPNSRVTFNADGTLVYGGNSPGTWKLDGVKLTFQINQYSEYDTVINDNVIEGIGWNKAGEKCQPKLYRSESATPDLLPPPILRNRGK